MWIQRTVINGVEKERKIERTDEQLLDMVVQLHLLKQAGEDIYVTRKVDENYNTISYYMKRTAHKEGHKTIEHFYEKVLDKK